MLCGDFSFLIYPAAASTRSVTVGHDDWGPPYPWRLSPTDQATGIPVPIPAGATVPPGTDNTVVVEQRNGSGATSGINVWEMWTSVVGTPWVSGWGGHQRLGSDGLQFGTFNGASGAAISHSSIIIRQHEIAAGWIPHPIAFSSDCVHTSSFVSPAQKTDGNNARGVATPIPEGIRFQLNPAASLTGLTRIQRIVARCLQVYGAYCYDIGGSSMAFAAERAKDADTSGTGKQIGSVYLRSLANGISDTALTDGGYINLDTGGTFPWSSLRALA
jgi:hypothetical protein